MAHEAGQWFCTPLSPALGGRGRQISEFEASLVYRVSFRTARATQRNHVSKKKAKTKRRRRRRRRRKKRKNEMES